MKPTEDSIVVVNKVTFTWINLFTVVDAFYKKVAINRHLRGPFNVVEDWPEHIERLTHFWWIRFGGKPYMDTSYNPIQKHFETGFSEELLEVWTNLFQETVSSILVQEQTDIWMMFVKGIGKALNYNNELMKLHHQG